MNPRLLQYLRSLGLANDAADDVAEDFLRGLRGVQASIANALNYNEADQAARTNCDLMIRALGYDPANPNNILATETPNTPQRQAGSDGASADGSLERRLREEGAAAERQRRSEIEQYATVAGCSEDFVRGLLNDATITADVARQRIFEDHRTRTRHDVPQDRPSGVAIHSRNSQTGYTVETLEAAMVLRSNIDPMTGWYRDANGTPTRARMAAIDLERHADAAHQLRSLSLEDMMRMASRLDNVNLPAGRDGLMRSYCEGLAARAFSTSALSAIFTTNVNSQLLATFLTAPDTTTGGWVRESEVADFKSNERARMKNGGTLDKLPRGSEANHASYEDVVETFKIARYAKQFVVDDQDIIDDTFGAINQHAPSDLGVAARQLRPDLIYSILLGNPTMRDSLALFHTSHGNYKASSGALSTWLGSARAAMRLQSENGRNLNIMPKFLLVPPTLEDTADTMLNSRVLIGASGTLTPENNPNYNKGLIPVVEARLENGVTDPTDPTGNTVHAGAADHWYLAAMANAHTIECAYRRGTGRVPQIRPFVLTQGRWGIGWDISHDIGAKALSWEGLYRSEA